MRALRVVRAPNVVRPGLTSRARTAVRTGVALGLTLLVACAPPRRAEPLTRATVDTTDPVLATGETVFNRWCHECHPGGEGGLGTSLNDKPWPGWMIRFQVRNGIGAMPRFDSQQISPEELDALVRYVLALRWLEPAETRP